MIERVWTGLLFAVHVAAAAVVAWCYVVPAPPLAVPLRPYREVSRCASGPLDWRLFDANGDDRPDIVILCEEELLVASGLNGETLWRQDLARPLHGSFAPPRGYKPLVVTGDVILVEYPKALVSFDAATGRSLWSKPFARIHPSVELHGDCLVVEYRDAPGATFSVRTGEPCTVPESPPLHRGPVGRRARATTGSRDGRVSVTLERGEEELWNAPCGDSYCDVQVTPGGVLVEGRWDDRCRRVLSFARGEVVRVLEPQDLEWSVVSLPPYLVAWRPLDPGPDRANRPVLEVFDATSFRTLWRSDPGEPEATWEQTDRCEPTLPDTHDSPIPLSSTDVVDAPCATGISPRPATGTDNVVFSLRRSGVSNPCYAYQVWILADGRVRYEGPCMDGVPDLQLPEGRLDDLIHQFNVNRFFDLCDATRHVGFDGGWMALDFWDGTHVKRVEADLLHWDETAALREFGDIVDDTIAIKRLLPDPKRR